MHSLRASSNSHPSLNTQFPLDLLPRFLPSFERLDHVTSTRNIIIIIISPYPRVRRNRKERERTLVEDNSSWMALSLGFQKSRGESLVKRDDFGTRKIVMTRKRGESQVIDTSTSWWGDERWWIDKIQLSLKAV